MLFKLSLRNIRKSLRDYAIYFFTLFIGVSVFYVFNAISGQAAALRISQSADFIIELLDIAISATSVAVAGVLGLLIVYASRFLMKRRSKEFALYMMLGMSKWDISAIILAETVIIGIGSLILGLLTGIGLSQLMSAVVANLFEADMTSYKFSISSDAVLKTIVYFAVMYLVVMVFNTFVITKMKLIDLIQSGRKSEQVKAKNPVVCIVMFLIAVAMLAFAYYKVGWDARNLNKYLMIACIVMGIIGTFLIFWSVSGMMLRSVMSVKSFYHNKLNCFTFRQISSKINTTVFSMTVICLMLFVTICTLTSAFSIRNSMNSNILSLCPVDFEGVMFYKDDQEFSGGVKEICEKSGYDLSEDLSDYVEYTIYASPDLTYSDSLGSIFEEASTEYIFIGSDIKEDIMKLSDYNALMRLYGRDPISLADDEYAVVCNLPDIKDFRNRALAENKEINIFGHTLKSGYDACIDGSTDISTDMSNAGIYIVPDAVPDEGSAVSYYLTGNYRSENKSEAEDQVTERFSTAAETAKDKYGIEEMIAVTRIMLKSTSVGMGAVAAFLGLYIGLVFIIACGAILALKELSDATDSISRYEMLRKIGTEEKDISASLFAQTGIFFLLPLLLAIIHSVFGMKFSIYVMQAFGTERVWESVIATSVILLLIYGGYFLVTHICGRSVIKDRR